MKRLVWINVISVAMGVGMAAWLVVDARNGAADDRAMSQLLRGNAAAASAALDATLAMGQHVQLSLSSARQDDGAGKKNEADDAFAAAVDQMRQLGTDPQARALVDEIAKADDVSLDPVEDKIMNLAAKDQKAAADLYFKDYAPAQAAQLRRLARLEVDQATRQLAENASASSFTANLTLATTLLILVPLVIAVAVTIRRVFAAMTSAVGALSDGAHEVVSAARQVATSSQTLSQGATEQAATLEETSASSEELASMTRRNAETALEGAALATQLASEVQASADALDGMVTSMAAIQDASQQVAKIIKTIDEIAFQTNILALNAAVEAARAGESGMGFAVVADEVRSLAQRSAQAAKDTAGLIETSISRTELGTAQVQRVATAITSLTDGVAKVKSLVDDVAGASQEQTRGFDQIATAVVQMEKVTQSTAATAEESAAASEELNAQAESTLVTVGRLETLLGRKTGSASAAGPAVVGQERKGKASVLHMPQRRSETRSGDGTGTYGKF